MSVKRRLKEVYKKSLTKIARSKSGGKVASFLSGTVSILEAESGKKNKAEISERLMVKKLIGEKPDGISVTDGIKAAHGENKGMYDISDSRLRVRVMHCNPGTLNAIQTICEAFQADLGYQLIVVLMEESGNSYALARQMEEKGFDFVFNSDYDIMKDKPDITIFYQLEYRYTDNIFMARQYSKMLVLVPLTLTTIWYGERSVSRMHLDKFLPDVMFATDLVMEKIRKNVSGCEILTMVPPQVDTVYRGLNENLTYPKGWEKLKGKKVMFYMTDHGLGEYKVSDELSFDLYLPTLMDYVGKEENKNVGLIIRPHFALLRELLSYHWSVADYRKFVDFCDKSENIIWDETDDFMNGLSVCDAVLSDLNTSVTYFSLASMKPIAITLRYDMPVKLENKDFTDGLYVLHSQENCIRFMNMVKQGKDPMRENRQGLFDRLIAPFDGENGKRIKEKIVSEYNKIIRNETGGRHDLL